MRLIVASTQVPFIRGGAEAMTEGLLGALRDAGHSVEQILFPFRFSPLSSVVQNMRDWSREDFLRFDAGEVDQVIALKFPAFHVNHPRKTVWLMHQHRSVYELYGTRFGEAACDENETLREEIVRADTEALATAKTVFTISRTVSDRLKKYNNVASKPLYQPPPGDKYLLPGPVFPYIYCPSRLEALKRQDLLIRAMPHVSRPIRAIIAGDGGMEAQYRALAEKLGVADRIVFSGRVDDQQMRRYYSNCLGVFFAPLMEDYGFITLEAMLSGKPVVTCTDSGGPTEFVVNEQTGMIVPPDPESIADSFNRIWASVSRGRDMGMAGLQRYQDLGVSWNNVVNELVL